MKKILYIGNFLKSWNTEEYIAKSFEQLGHYVKRLNERELTNREILKEINENNYDFLLYAKLRIDGDIEKLFKKINIPTVCWFFDNFINTIREKSWLKRPWITKCDYLFTTDGGHQKEFKELGINNKCIRKGIFQDEAYISNYYEKKIDILFVGNYNHVKTRKKLIDFLKNTYGNRFKLVGHNKKSIIRQDKLNDLFANTKIVIGDNTFDTDGYWSNRVYETLGRGGFLITQYVKGLEKEFIDGKHLVLYKDRNLEELKEKINYYLTHNYEREEIRLNGFFHCRKHFTYKKRCKKLLQKI